MKLKEKAAPDLLFVIVLSISFSQTLSKTCYGTTDELSYSSTPLERLNSYKIRYENCVRVEGNLELIELPIQNLNLSFLTSIEEITGYLLVSNVHAEKLWLDKLRLIRGETLYHMNPNDSDSKEMSVFIINNIHSSGDYGLTELGLSSLVEITRGDVLFFGNPLLCYPDKIVWKDIFNHENSSLIPDVTVKSRQCKCHDNCLDFEGTKHCWGPGEHNCQKLTKLTCKEVCGDRCFGADWNQCCAITCSGGCTGRSNSDCFRCTKFSNDGNCLDSCPPPKIYNHQTFLWQPNPEARYAYGHDCLRKCPDHMYVDGGACVRICSFGFMPSGSNCVPCDGPCPKVCPGTKEYLSSLNYQSFQDCTIIDGNLIIVDTTFRREYDYLPMTYDQLRVLENVTLIEGFLSIDANSSLFTNVSFLRNLKTISGKFLKSGIALLIYKTSLKSLGLDSLTTVTSGKVLVSSNPDLCYGTDLEELNWKSIVKDSSTQQIILMDNKNITQCELEGHKCADECKGCFGPLNSQCQSCKNFKQGDRCVPSCEQDWFVSSQSEANSSRPIICQKCHDQCLGGCYGKEADKCNRCLNFKDGPYCVENCPQSKYHDEVGQCENCSFVCDGGCTGPEDTVGLGGCKSCSLVIMDESGTKEIRCLNSNASCPSEYYLYRNKQCQMCHSECYECQGPGSSNCDLSKCKNAIYDNKCVARCPGNYYMSKVFSPPMCQECNGNCLSCYGPTSVECDSCRQLKVYLDYANRENNPKFNCTSSCPDWAPNKIQEEIDLDKNTICVSNEFVTELLVGTKKSRVDLIVGLILGGLILLGLIAALIFFLRRQRTRWELEKTKIEAKIGGFDETEPLALTNAAPDKSRLRIIKESELRKEEVIGSGAFGTVHKGAWVPAGEHVRIPVAIKILNEGTNSAMNKELLDEARIMASVDHPNCVKISAICMTNPIQLVTPLMPFGSLLDYIRKNKQCIGSRALLTWTTQIARGMKYLEDKGIVHRDLAARNVLVRNANMVKITDFGLSKLLDVDQSQILTQDEKLPIKWMAIESIHHRIFTHKSDVWSYGVTIWEMFTYGQRPYEYLSATDVLETLEKGERLTQPEICTIDVYMIMIKCWMVDAASRPNFQELVDEFTKMSRDPGRYLVIQDDEFMKLPVHNVDTKDLIKDDGPEEIVSAEDYYLQPVEGKKLMVDADGKRKNPYVETSKNKLPNQSGDVLFSDIKKKSKDNTDSEIDGNKYTSDPTERSGGLAYKVQPSDDGELDQQIEPYSDYKPSSLLVIDDKYNQQKGSTSSLSGTGKNKLEKDKKQRNKASMSEYLKMSRSSSKEDSKAMLAEFEDDDDDDDYLTSNQPLTSGYSSNKNITDPQSKNDYYNVGGKGRLSKNYNVSDV